MTAKNYRRYVCESCCGEISSEFIEKCSNLGKQINNDTESLAIRESNEKVHNSLVSLIDVKDNVISQQEAVINSLKGTMETNKATSAHKDESLIDVKDNVISQQEAVINSLKGTMETNKATSAHKDESLIDVKDNVISQQEAVINSLKGTIETNKATSAHKDESLIAVKDNVISQQEAVINSLKGTIETNKATSAHKDESLIAVKDNVISQQEAVINSLKGTIETNKATLAHKDEVISEQLAAIISLKTHSEFHITDRDRDVAIKHAERNLALEEKRNYQSQLQHANQDNLKLTDEIGSLREILEQDKYNMSVQKKKLHEANIILEKTEIAYNAHADTVSAKEQVIHHQKTIIDNQETIINSLKLRTTTTVDAEADKNGEITNAVLVWIDIQRMTTAENIWKTQALSHFTTDEISTAKNEMWDRCGEHRLGKLIRRQGSSKTKAELDDLAAAFKTLAENETLPSFIASSETLRRTPLFNVDITNNTNDAIATRLKILEETINAAISMNKVFIPKNEKMVDKSTSAGKSNRNDITGSNNALYSDIVVQQQSIRKPITNDENRTKQILGQKRILHGTSHDQSRDMTFAADIDLVAYGVSIKVTGNHLSKFIEDKGIKVLGCVLLTKYEHARTLSYKVTIKACDYEKSQDPSI